MAAVPCDPITFVVFWKWREVGLEKTATSGERLGRFQGRVGESLESTGIPGEREEKERHRKFSRLLAVVLILVMGCT
jgi:hypothetical protein